MAENIERSDYGLVDSHNSSLPQSDIQLRKSGLFVVLSQAIWTIVAVSFAALRADDLPWLDDFLLSLSFAGLFVSAGAGYAVYLLVNRRNIHLAKEQLVMSESIARARSKSSQNDLKVLIPLSSAERDFVNFSHSSGEKSAILWGLLSAVPYVGWLAIVYSLWFLTSEMKKHEISEDALIQDLDRAVRASGGPGFPVRPGRSPSRNSFVYVGACLLFLSTAAFGMIRSISAIGLRAAGLSAGPSLLDIALLSIGIVGFGIIVDIWLYLEIEDPRPHLAFHQGWEQSVLEARDASTFQFWGLSK